MKRTHITLAGFLTVVATVIAVTGALVFSAVPVAGHPLRQGVGGVYIKSHRVTVTIDNQVAVTKVEQIFVNETQSPAEGTYLFPLPVGAAVSNLVMYINGVPIHGQLLDAKQAQQIYTETVRRLRDPALLQYVGRSAIQANVFPYTYPLKTDYASPLPVQQVSVSVDVISKDPISTVYSPNPLIAISRTDDKHFKAGFETVNYRATDDFSVYYGVASSEINANLRRLLHVDDHAADQS
jgi:Ca-activated chloride channel homolog